MSKHPLEAAVKATTDDIVDDLISQFGSNPTIPIEVAGKKFTFEAIVDRREFNRIKARAKEFMKVGAAPVPQIAELFDTDDETKAWAFILATVSIEPKFEPIHFLKLAKHACFAFDEIKYAYLIGLAQERTITETEGIDQRKN